MLKASYLSHEEHYVPYSCDSTTEKCFYIVLRFKNPSNIHLQGVSIHLNLRTTKRKSICTVTTFFTRANFADLRFYSMLLKDQTTNDFSIIRRVNTENFVIKTELPGRILKIMLT